MQALGNSDLSPLEIYLLLSHDFNWQIRIWQSNIEKKAFKFVPNLILGKIIFALWFISYLVQL